MRGRILTISFLFLFSFSLRAQSGLGLLFYDVDRLYDTVPALFYDDTEFTPNGKMHWTAERYQRKVAAIAQVLDSVKMPLVGLYGVENESVVRDIQTICAEDYSVVHLTRNSFDGLDFALLYYGDVFYVESQSVWRDMMVVDGDYLGCKLTIILARDGRDVAPYLEENECGELIVVAGDVSTREIKSWGFENLLAEGDTSSYGNTIGRWGWYFKHRIAVNNRPAKHQSGAYIAPYLLNNDGRSIFSTYRRDNYIGGYSVFLPIYSYIFY